MMHHLPKPSMCRCASAVRRHKQTCEADCMAHPVPPAAPLPPPPLPAGAGVHRRQGPARQCDAPDRPARRGARKHHRDLHQPPRPLRARQLQAVAARDPVSTGPRRGRSCGRRAGLRGRRLPRRRLAACVNRSFACRHPASQVALAGSKPHDRQPPPLAACSMLDPFPPPACRACMPHSRALHCLGVTTRAQLAGAAQRPHDAAALCQWGGPATCALAVHGGPAGRRTRQARRSHCKQAGWVGLRVAQEGAGRPVGCEKDSNSRARHTWRPQASSRGPVRPAVQQPPAS